jgi:alkanesulfonate monooxygenase SsuD/methylene tetrahydromethanopterin reductase-like flavin-dependent oxidoreductase (luciferase family)
MADHASSSPVGLVLGSHIPPEQIPSVAQLAERGGFGELWLAEDYFFTGGISGAMAALSATSTIPVGLGIVSAMARHPALLAMEIATAARVHPGRLWAGIGLGTPQWIRQMGVHPKSPLTAMRESITTIKRLLAGEEVTLDGKVFQCDAIQLSHTPDEPVPIFMGAIGPKMLALSGEIADGTVVSALAGTNYLHWMHERVAEGQASTGPRDHRVCTFAIYCVDADGQAARKAIEAITLFYLALPPGALTDAYGISEQLADMQARGGENAQEVIGREMPAQWLEDLVIAGDPDECAQKIQALLDAGSDSVALFPVPVERSMDIVDMTAREVLPQLRANEGAQHG